MTDWLLIRGWSREVEHWGGFVEQMEAHFPAQKIITIDLPGCGEFNKISCPWNIKGVVSFLRKQLQEKHPDVKSINILGLSLGAMCALEWKQNFPNEVKKLVLLNSSATNLSPFHRRLRFENYHLIFTMPLFFSNWRNEKKILKMVSSLSAKQKHKTLIQWTNIRKNRPVSTWNLFRQLVAAVFFKCKKEMSFPEDTLLLCSRGDSLVHSSCSEDIANFLNLKNFYIHPSAGHEITLDDSYWVLDKIKETKREVI